MKGEASEDARAADATVEEREAAVNDPRVFLAGLLEIIPIARVIPTSKLPELAKLLEKIPPEKVETIGERIASAGITGTAEGLQEATSNVLLNLTEQEYNAAAETFGGTGESFALGGGAGAILQGFVDLFAPRRGAKTVGDAVEEAAPVEEVVEEADIPVGTQPDLALDIEEAEVIDGEAIRAQVFKGFKKPFDQLTEKQQKTIQNRIVALSPAEFDALERVIEPTTEARPPEVSPDQIPFPGLEPERARFGPQLQGLPAPEKEKRALGDVERQDVFVPRRGRKAERDLERQLERRRRDTDTVAGETLAVTPEGEALGREEQRERLARLAR